MTPLHDCVLVFEQQANNLRRFEPLLKRWSCRMLTTSSVDQFLDYLVQGHPYLVILAGPCRGWPTDFSHQVRQAINQYGGTVLALTEDTDEQSSEVFLQQNDSMLDGCLVEPLDEEVFTSILHAAKARQFMGVV